MIQYTWSNRGVLNTCTVIVILVIKNTFKKVFIKNKSVDEDSLVRTFEVAMGLLEFYADDLTF